MKRVYFKILLLTLLTRFTVFILFASRKNSPSNNSIAFSIGFEQRHNNFENMFEAFFHVKNGKSPFSGNVFHGNPLLLYFLLLLKINKLSYFKSKFALHLLTSICDFIAAINLMEIVNFVETKDAAKSPKTKEKSTFSILIAILYVSNPFAIFNSIISFSTINYCLLFVTVKNALKRRTLSSCLFFSLLIFTEIYALLFFPLLIAIFYKKEETIFNKVSKIALLTLLVAFFVGTPIYLLSKEKFCLLL
ncbi:hypothetical protein MHBO_000337 [Bonamia ostreae]|uniref:GPI mannosyltransferase 2 n=2 Tax=Bonamia ostreae TaxID=126728 RepID=A0ABV2AFC8_9EUKA